MICAAIEDFAATLPRAGAIAGLDLGTKTIGVAVSDGLRGDMRAMLDAVAREPAETRIRLKTVIREVRIGVRQD